MYYDSLPEWNEIERKIETYEELDPVERFIHEHTPGGAKDEKIFRRQLQEALYFFGRAPQKNVESQANAQHAQAKIAEGKPCVGCIPTEAKCRECSSMSRDTCELCGDGGYIVSYVGGRRIPCPKGCKMN